MALVRPTDRSFNLGKESTFGGLVTPDTTWNVYGNSQIKPVRETILAPESTGLDANHKAQKATGVTIYEGQVSFPLRTGMTDLLFQWVQGRTPQAIEANSDLVIANDAGNQLSVLILSNPIKGTNVDAAGIAYIDIVDAGGGDRTVTVWSDVGRSAKVAEGTRTGNGVVTLLEENASGLTGSVTLTFTGGDVDITATISNVTYTRSFPATTSCTVEIDEVSDIERYSGVRCDSISLVMEKNQPLNVELAIVAKALQKLAAGNATVSTPDSSSYFKLEQAVLTINSETYKIISANIEILNSLWKEDHRNNPGGTIVQLPAMFRDVTFGFDLPWGTDADSPAKDLVDDFLAATDRSATLLFTSGTDTLEFTFETLEMKETGRNIADKETPINSTFECVAYADDDTDSVEIRTSF